MPLYTKINKKQVEVKKVLGRMVFPLSEATFTPIDKEELKDAVRIFGSGGFCGYLGWFRNSNLGNFFLLIKNKENLVLIKWKEKKYIINLIIGNDKAD